MHFITRPLSLLLSVALVFGQQVGENKKPTEAPPTFSVSSTLVIETVSVKDKEGKVIKGLTAKDFTVTEDGVPQEIKHFEFMELPETLNNTPTQFATREMDNIQILNKLPHQQITPETPGNLLYKNRRLLALYFDM